MAESAAGAPCSLGLAQSAPQSERKALGCQREDGPSPRREVDGASKWIRSDVCRALAPGCQPPARDTRYARRVATARTESARRGTHNDERNRCCTDAGIGAPERVCADVEEQDRLPGVPRHDLRNGARVLDGSHSQLRGLPVQSRGRSGGRKAPQRHFARSPHARLAAAVESAATCVAAALAFAGRGFVGAASGLDLARLAPPARAQGRLNGDRAALSNPMSPMAFCQFSVSG